MYIQGFIVYLIFFPITFTSVSVVLDCIVYLGWRKWAKAHSSSRVLYRDERQLCYNIHNLPAWLCMYLFWVMFQCAWMCAGKTVWIDSLPQHTILASAKILRQRWVGWVCVKAECETSRHQSEWAVGSLQLFFLLSWRKANTKERWSTFKHKDNGGRWQTKQCCCWIYTDARYCFCMLDFLHSCLHGSVCYYPAVP